MEKLRFLTVKIAVMLVCFTITVITMLVFFSERKKDVELAKEQTGRTEINEILNQRFPQTSDAASGIELEDETSVGELPDEFIEHITERTIVQLRYLRNLPPPTDNAKQLVPHIKSGLEHAVVSPDGKHVIFRLLEEDDSVSDIYLYSLENKTYQNLTEFIAGPRPWNASFSPDSKSVLINGFPHSGLWLLDISDGRLGESTLLLDNADILMADWSPDGKTLTYTEADGDYGSHIVLFDLEKKSVLKLIGENSNRYDKVEASRFSPDGNSLVYVRKKKTDGRWTGQLIIENLQTGIVKVVAEGPSQKAFKTPVFSPDGKKIAFGANTGNSTEIYTLNPSDGTVKRITQGGGTSPSWLSNETIIFGSRRKTGISSVYSINIDE
jgi:Tol biopolymer transport system component